MHSLTAVCLIALVGLCSAQAPEYEAPGDEDRDRCVDSPTYRHTYPDNVNVLMDSWNYEQLLPGHSDQPIPGAVWTDASCDNNDDAQFPFITPPYWQHGAGGICRWQAQVCGYTVGDQNNWLFTQNISKAVPAPDTYTVRVFVNVTYGFQSCRTRNRCNPQFKVLKYISNSPQLNKRDTCSDTSLYSGSGIMPNNTIGTEFTDGVVSDQRYFDMSTSDGGLYLALQDVSVGNLRGTCMGINRLIVYRHECPAQAVGLVRYPATQAPVSGTVSVQTQCVGDAHRSSSSLSVRCDSDGHWSSGSPECECDLGYREVTRDGKQVCEACPAGTYRSSGDTECQPCPANTMRDQVATGQCQCQDGYFRNDITEDITCSSLLTASNEGAGTGCTQPPGAPASVSVSAVSARSIRVTWSRPSQRGGRSDLHYTLDYSDPDTRGQYIGTTCKGSSSTSHTFIGLRPDTQYCIRVSAHNGVSDQGPNGAHPRTEERCTTTPAARPGSVTEVQVLHQVQSNYPAILWEPPDEPNGVITGYELTFTRGGQSNTVTTTMPYYVIQSQNVPGSSGSFTMEVKAQNSAGTGQGVSKVIDPTDPTCPTCPTPQACDSCCPECDSCCEDCPTCPTCPTCSTAPPCDSCCDCPTCPTPPPCDSCCEDCPTCPTCPTPPPCDSCCEECPTCPPDPVVTLPGAVTDIHVLGCGIVSWKPPADTGGEMPGYAIRFFDGETYESSRNSYREIQRHFDDPDRRWAVATNVPRDRPIYVDIRASNSAGASDFSEKVVVADSTICTEPDPPTCPTQACDSCCEGCPTCPTCPTPPPCDSCCEDCPTAPTCPTCPTCPACDSCCTDPPPCDSCCEDCPTAPTCPTCPTDPAVTLPGAVSTNDIQVLGCGIVSWKPPADTGGEIPGYAIRFFDGETYESSRNSYREIQRHFDDPGRQWAVATDVPRDRPVYVDIRAANSAGAGSYSQKKIVADSTICSEPDPTTQPPPDPTCPTCPTPQACDSCCPTCSTPPACDSCCTDPPPCDSCCRDCPTCPTPPACDSCCEGCPTCPTDPVTPPGAVSTDDIQVLGCGIVSWKPPEDTGGELPGYAIRFFDGETYESSRNSYREIQRHFDDPGRQWAIATNVPRDRPIYVDIRAANSAGAGDFSQKKIVADSNLCSETDCLPCDSCCTDPPPCDSCCPTCEPTLELELDVKIHVGLVHLTWSPVDGAQGYDVMYYKNERKPDEGKPDEGEVYKTVNETAVQIDFKFVMEHEDFFVEIVPQVANKRKRSAQNYSSEAVRINAEDIMKELNSEGEVEVATSGLSSSDSETETTVDGTAVAISMLVTFVVTAAAVAFLAIVLGLLLHSYVNKKNKKRSLTYGRSYAATD